MFTGLIEEVGTLKAVVPGALSARLTIRANKVLQGVQVGDSIATSGICLTVTAFDRESFTVDVMAETMRMTNLGSLIPGSPVNLERALALGARLGGHMISGHIDGTGTLAKRKAEDNAIWLTIDCPGELLRYIVEKGSIAIDGVSLTVANVGDSWFSVSIIPHTGEATTLLQKQPGDTVNLECDIIGKYVEKLMGLQTGPTRKKEIDLAFLQEHGF